MTEPRQYRDRNAPDPEKERKRIEKIHNGYPDAYGLASVFQPSGLVPYPCGHGIPVKPARYPVTKGGKAWFDEKGREKPPFGGLSWGRAKYLGISSFGGRDGVPYAIAECIVCTTHGAPQDFYIAADGSSLR